MSADDNAGMRAVLPFVSFCFPAVPALAVAYLGTTGTLHLGASHAPLLIAGAGVLSGTVFFFATRFVLAQQEAG